MTGNPPELEPRSIGERLLVSRQAVGLAQKDYAEMAGLASNTYNQYENGKARPSIDNAVALVQAHRLTLDWIYLGDPSGLQYALADAIKAIRTARRTERGPLG